MFSIYNNFQIMFVIIQINKIKYFNCDNGYNLIKMY